MTELSMPEANYVPFLNSRSNPNWELMILPTTTNRYNPKRFHVGMFNEWTNEVCSDHRHKDYDWFEPHVVCYT